MKDIEKIARAIEADGGQALPQLRQALSEAAQRKGRTTTPEQMLVRAARVKLSLSQAELAERIGTPVATLRDWEQGRFAPPGVALRLLRLLLAHPGLVNELAAA
ncbi:MAG: helix-turn-helix domain-containing protein [Proteobacteria bacterium]|nr:helix-turn-helix domain-containing protein [Pseudomonadota bacterium]MBS0463857.1 helix-turn-helix domain-containing protein [Pseudomonadota bacterium]